jgi:hypothetical protein
MTADETFSSALADAHKLGQDSGRNGGQPFNRPVPGMPYRPLSGEMDLSGFTYCQQIDLVGAAFRGWVDGACSPQESAGASL